jgi:hypothetical protein
VIVGADDEVGVFEELSVDIKESLDNIAAANTATITIAAIAKTVFFDI